MLTNQGCGLQLSLQRQWVNIHAPKVETYARLSPVERQTCYGNGEGFDLLPASPDSEHRTLGG